MILKNSMNTKKIVGRKEKISILDLELFDLDAKVDTGVDSKSAASRLRGSNPLSGTTYQKTP